MRLVKVSVFRVLYPKLGYNVNDNVHSMSGQWQVLYESAVI